MCFKYEVVQKSTANSLLLCGPTIDLLNIAAVYDLPQISGPQNNCSDRFSAVHNVCYVLKVA